MDRDASRKIIHIDMDAFFASVEQRDDPAVRGRPVAVGYGAARGVVAAASYEAREFGVRSALPSVTALRKCPDLVFVPPRFEVYRLSRAQIHGIFADYTPLIQPLSLDEAYLDVTENRAVCRRPGRPPKRSAPHPGGDGPDRLGRHFLQQVPREARLGSAQARTASSPSRPTWAGLGGDAPVARFHGVGPVTARRMQRWASRRAPTSGRSRWPSCRSISAAPPSWYHAIARAQDDRPVDPDRTRKSSGSETTFLADLVETPRSRRACCGWRTTSGRGARRRQAFGRTVTVKVKFADFRADHAQPEPRQAR
jgi:DNA polymerase-4